MNNMGNSKSSKKCSRFITPIITKNIHSKPECLDIFPEIVNIICSYLDDVDKTYFLSAKKYLNNLKCNFSYDKQVTYEKIENLIYKNNFVSIIVNNNTMFNQIVGYKYLEFDHKFDNPIDNYNIPVTVLSIKFGMYFDHPVKNKFPEGLEILEFGYCFNQSIKNTIPSTVKKLIFGFNFDHDIKRKLPDKLEYLILGTSFNHPIVDAFPSTLKYLKLPHRYNNWFSYLHQRFPECYIEFGI
jgi:hypothetical protein